MLMATDALWESAPQYPMVPYPSSTYSSHGIKHTCRHPDSSGSVMYTCMLGDGRWKVQAQIKSHKNIYYKFEAFFLYMGLPNDI